MQAANNNGPSANGNVNPRANEDIDPGTPSGPNMSNVAAMTLRHACAFFVRLFRGSVKFVRHYMNVDMLNNEFNQPINEEAREEWAEALDQIAGHARRRMDFSLKKVEDLRIVSVIAKAKAGTVSIVDSFN